jgi:hypothetical protein
MKAVKSFAEGFFEGGILRIAHGHSQPCDGLENSPMRADAKHQRENDRPMGQFAQHDGTVENVLGKSRGHASVCKGGLIFNHEHNLSPGVAALT